MPPVSELTLAPKLEVEHIGDLNVDDAEEALVLLSFKLALIKDLDRHDRRVLDRDIKVFVPVWVEGALYNRGGVNLLGVDAHNRERVGKAENVALDQRVGSDDW